MFLARLLADRIAFNEKRAVSEEHLLVIRAEFHRLVAFLSEGPVYPRLCRDGATADEIKTKKTVFNMLLNRPNEGCRNHQVWESIRRRFPNTIGVIEAIKRKDHRSLSKQFQHFTAHAISTALLELQALGIPAIPDTDCLIVREKDKAAACAAIGKAMFNETRGVLVTVGGIVFAPLLRP